MNPKRVLLLMRVSSLVTVSFEPNDDWTWLIESGYMIRSGSSSVTLTQYGQDYLEIFIAKILNI